MQPSAKAGRYGDFPVLYLADELDASMEAELRNTLDSFERSGRHLIIDLTDVSYVDSSALGLILALDAHVNAKEGALAITSPQPMVRRVFRATGMLDMLKIFDTLDEAAGFLRERADAYASSHA